MLSLWVNALIVVAAPEAPSTGLLVVEGTPKGARVEFGGSVRLLPAHLPVRLDQVPIGEYELRVSARGYRSQKVTIEVRAKQTTSHTIKLVQGTNFDRYEAGASTALRSQIYTTSHERFVRTFTTQKNRFRRAVNSLERRLERLRMPQRDPTRAGRPEDRELLDWYRWQLGYVWLDQAIKLSELSQPSDDPNRRADFDAQIAKRRTLSQDTAVSYFSALADAFVMPVKHMDDFKRARAFLAAESPLERFAAQQLAYDNRPKPQRVAKQRAGNPSPSASCSSNPLAGTWLYALISTLLLRRRRLA